MIETSDISSDMTTASLTPEEGAEALKGGQLFSIDPMVYHADKANFDAQLNQSLQPSQASPTVKSYVARGPAEASAIKNDTEQLSGAEKYMKFVSDTWKGVDVTREKSALAKKKMDQGGVLSPEDDFKLAEKRVDEESLTGSGKYDYNMLEAFPATALGVSKNYIQGLIDNYRVIAAPTVVGATTGGTIGAFGGPMGAAGGALAVGTSGLSMGIMAAGAVDNYNQTAGDIYDTLDQAKKEDGTPLNVPQDTKTAISRGAAVLATMVDYVGDRAVMRTLPVVGKFFKPKELAKELISNPAMVSWKKTVIALGKNDIIHSMMAEGSTEGIQEMIQIYAEQLGKSFDGSEVSFQSALNHSLTPESGYRVFENAFVGSLMGGTVSGLGKPAGMAIDAGKSVVGKGLGMFRDKPAASLETGSLPINNPPEVPVGASGPDVTAKRKTDLVPSSTLPNPILATTALNQQIALAQISAVTKNTELHENSPSQISEIRKEMLDKAGIDYVIVDKESANEHSDTQAKADAVRESFGEPQLQQAAIDAPIIIEAHKFLEVVDHDINASGMVKETPEGMSAKQYADAHTKAEESRQKLVGAPAEESVNPPEIVESDVHNESEYLNQPTFTEAIESIIPLSEKQKFNEAQRFARLEVVEAIDHAAEHEMDKVIDVTTEIMLTVEEEQLAAEITKNPHIKMVDDFLAGNPVSEVGARALDNIPMIEHRKQGTHPNLAIDPESLNPDLKRRWLKDKNLQKRKVFKKGGLPIETVMSILGATNKEHFLKILSSTPTSIEAQKKEMALRAKAIEAKVADNVDLNETAIAKAYSNTTRNHIEEMKYLLKQNWSDVKTGIRRIALPLPTIGELRTKAATIVGSTKVKMLNANQYKVGERRSQAKAIKTILMNQVEQAFKFKENAALNSELARATHIAIGKANRNIRFLSRMMSERNQEILKNAGASHLNAWKELSDVFNFDPRNKGESKQGSYLKFVESKINAGEGDYTIPDSIVEGMDTRISVKNLTVDQISFLTDRARNILHQAKLKDALLQDYKENLVEQTEDSIAESLHEEAINHPAYNDSPSKPVKSLRGTEKIGFYLAKAVSTISPLSYITLELDKGINGGKWSQIFYQALKGVGVHEGAWGEAAAKTLNLAIEKEYNKRIEIYGRSDFNKLGITKVSIPEFAGLHALNGGELYKSDLIKMLSNFGNAENRERLGNYGISPDEIFEVLKRELQPRDFDFVQHAIWDIHESLKPRIKALEEYTEGTSPEFVEDLGFVAHGKEYRGGYAPLHYEESLDSKDVAERVKNQIESVTGEEKTDYRPSYAAQGVTKRNYLKDRTGSKRTLTLDMGAIALGFEEVTYDLTMRVPVRDTLKLLHNQSIARDIIAIVGHDKYQLMVNTSMEATNSAMADKIRLFNSQQSFFKKAFSRLDSAFAITQLAGNMSSFMIQPVSMLSAWERMGIKSGSKHLKNALFTVFNPVNHKLRGQYFALALEINPDIGSYIEGSSTTGGIEALNPKKRLFDNKGYYHLKNFQEGVNQALISKVLGLPDFIQKVTIALAGYSQYMAGDAPGVDINKVMALSPDMRHAQAKAYAQHLSATTLTTDSKIDKAAAQKLQIFQHFVKFWNDARNQLNNSLQVNRNIKYDFQAAIKESKNGNLAKAQDHFDDAGTKMLTAFAVTVIASMFQKTIRGDGEDPIEGSDFLNPGKLTEKVASMFIDAPFDFIGDRYAQNIPVVRDGLFALRSREKGWAKLQAVSLPITRVATDVVTGISGIMGALDLADISGEMSQKELKGLLSGASYVTGGAPVNAAFKLYDNSDTVADATLGVIGGGVGLMQMLKDRINQFLDKHDTQTPADQPITDEDIKKAEAAISEENKRMQEVVKEVKEIKAQIEPDKKEELISNYIEIIKAAEGNHTWNAVNDVTGAFGYYQFMPDTWEGIREQHPELKLMAFDKLDNPKNKKKSIVDQQKAIEVLTKSITNTLDKKGIEVTEANIYALHFLGEGRGARVLQANDNKLLARIVGPAVMRQNLNADRKWFVPRWKVRDFKAWTEYKMQHYAPQVSNPKIDNKNN